MPRFFAGPHTVGGALCQSVGRTVKMKTEKQRGREKMGSDSGWRGQCVGRGHGESRVESWVLLARGVNVELTLEDVVDDWLGQVIHDMAVPMLQGQPA